MTHPMGAELPHRLWRTASRPGLLDRAWVLAMLTRHERMVAGLPLSGLVSRHTGAAPPALMGELPLVHAAPPAPERSLVDTPAAPRPAPSAAVPRARVPTTPGGGPRQPEVPVVPLPAEPANSPPARTEPAAAPVPVREHPAVPVVVPVGQPPDLVAPPPGPSGSIGAPGPAGEPGAPAPRPAPVVVAAPARGAEPAPAVPNHPAPAPPVRPLPLVSRVLPGSRDEPRNQGQRPVTTHRTAGPLAGASPVAARTRPAVPNHPTPPEPPAVQPIPLAVVDHLVSTVHRRFMRRLAIEAERRAVR